MSICSRAYQILQLCYQRLLVRQCALVRATSGSMRAHWQWNGLEPLERRALFHGEISFDVIALENNPAGDTALVFTDLSGPVINRDGQVLFVSQIDGPEVDEVNNTALWTRSPDGLQLVARSGSAAPGIEDGKFGLFLDDARFNLTESGQVVFSNLFFRDESAAPESEPFGFGLWAGSPDNLGLVAQFQDFLDTAAPVGQGDLPEDFSLLLGGDLANGDNQVVFVGVVPDAGQESGQFIDAAIWAGEADNVEIVARKGDPAPDTDQLFGDVFIPAALNGSGGLLMLASLEDGDPQQDDPFGIWFGGAGELELVAKPGDPAPDVQDSTFGHFLLSTSVNDAGRLALLATLDDEATSGIWAGQAGDLDLIALEGEHAPGTGDDVRFALFLSAPIVNAAGDVIFTALLEGQGVDASNDVGIWAADENGLRLIARTGDSAPGPGGEFVFDALAGLDFGLLEGEGDVTFPLLVSNARGQIIFTGKVSGEGIDETNDRGVWIADGDGQLRLVAQEGTTLEVADGDSRVISPDAFSLSGDDGGGENSDDFFIDDLLGGVISGGQDGRRTVLGDDGQIVVPLGFDDGTTGIILFDAHDEDIHDEAVVTAQFEEVKLPPAVVAGQETDGKVKVAITNEGTASTAEPVEVELVLRPVDAVSVSRDIVLAHSTITSLEPGQTSKLSLGVTVGETVDEGRYHLVILIDGQDEAVSEEILTVDSPFVDLTGVFGDRVRIQDTVVPGDKINIPIIVTNRGNVPVDGRIDIELFVSTDAVLDEADSLIETDDLEDLRVKLGVGKSKKFHFKDQVPLEPQGLAPGRYFLLANIVPLEPETDADLSNNVVTVDESGQELSFDIQWQFGNVDGRRGRTKLVGQTDEDDGAERVTITLTGAGVGQVVVDPETEEVSIVLTDTDASTKVKVNVKGGDERLEVDHVFASDPVGQFDGRDLDIAGDARFLGGIEKLRLGDVAHDHLIEIGGSLDAEPVTIELDRVVDAQIISATPIKSLKVTELLSDEESDDGPSVVIAPSIAKLQAKGDKKRQIEGDFDAALELDGSDEAERTLGTVKIAGDVHGVLWDITGDVGKVDIKGEVVDWQLDVHSDVGNLKLGAVESSSVSVDGQIKNIDAVAWIDGAISADTINKIQVKGDRRIKVEGDFNVDLTLAGSDDPSVKKTLNKAKVFGDVQDSTWDVTGDVGRIEIRGLVDGWTLDVHSDVDNLKLGLVDSADVSVDGHIQKLETTRWVSGSLAADSIGVLMAKGGRRHHIEGDFGPGVNLAGGDSESKAKRTLNNAKIAGLLTGQWVIAATNGDAVGTLTAGAIDAGFSGSFGGLVKGVTTRGDAGGFFAAQSFKKMEFKGNVANLEVLTGANLGSDGKLGGEDDAADGFGAGDLENFKITGDAENVTLRVGMDPMGTAFDDGDDTLDSGPAELGQVHDRRGVETTRAWSSRSMCPSRYRIDGEKNRPARGRPVQARADISRAV